MWERFFSKLAREARDEKEFNRQVAVLWESRFELADKAIRDVINSLPPEILQKAQSVPFLLEKWPPEDWDRLRTLGLYSGFEPGMVSREGGRIFIFIGPPHLLCEREDLNFEKEIRRTYLHELGHHLGLDEGDLEERHL